MTPVIFIRFRDETENHVFPYLDDTASSFAERAMKSACRTLGATPDQLSADEDARAPAVRAYLLRGGHRVAQVVGLTADEASAALLSLAAQRWAPGQDRELGLHADKAALIEASVLTVDETAALADPINLRSVA